MKTCRHVPRALVLGLSGYFSATRYRKRAPRVLHADRAAASGGKSAPQCPPKGTATRPGGKSALQRPPKGTATRPGGKSALQRPPKGTATRPGGKSALQRPPTGQKGHSRPGKRAAAPRGRSPYLKLVMEGTTALRQAGRPHAGEAPTERDRSRCRPRDGSGGCGGGPARSP